jgi:hypothetical protein
MLHTVLKYERLSKLLFLISKYRAVGNAVFDIFLANFGNYRDKSVVV